MSIYTLNYCKTFCPKPDFTRILGISTYNTLHQIKFKIKTNIISVHLNLGGATRGHIGLLMLNKKYATLPNAPYVRSMQPAILIISNNAAHVV